MNLYVTINDNYTPADMAFQGKTSVRICCSISFLPLKYATGYNNVIRHRICLPINEHSFIFERFAVTNLTWQIMAMKFDNAPHYAWPATLRDDNGERLRFDSVIGGLLKHYTRGFEEPQWQRSAFTFWRERWYNVFTNYDKTGALDYLYCNVAMPLKLDSNSLTYVDLDLDVKFAPNGEYVLLDQEEFEAHAVKFAYPDWLQEKALNAVTEIIALAASREEPFDILKRNSL